MPAHRKLTQAGSSYVEALILLAVLGLGVIAGMKALQRSTLDAGERTGVAIVRLSPLDMAKARELSAGDDRALPLMAAEPVAWNTGASEPGAAVQGGGTGSEQHEESLWGRALSFLSDAKDRELANARENQKGVRGVADWVRERIDGAKESAINSNMQQTDLVRDVPVLGSFRGAANWVLNTREGLAAGFARQAVNMVDSTLEMVANPYDTVAGLPEFIEHVPVTTSGGIGPNPLKLLRADNDEERARALDLRESLLDDWRFQTKQFEQDYNNGDYAEITGRVGFEGVMVVLPFLKALRGKPPLPEPPPIRPPPPLAHLPDPPLEPPTPHLPDPPPERPAPPPHEAPEHPPAKPPAEAPVLRSDPNKLQPAKRGDGFDLRDSMVENHDLIRGRPEATDLDSAARELATAEYAARNEHEVLMGKEADRAINKGMKDPNGNDLPSADVVAKLRNGNYRLYEAKGANGIGDAVEQLEHSGKQLGANSVESYTVACKPPINEPGYAVRNGELLLHGEPARIGGKPIQVIFVQ